MKDKNNWDEMRKGFVKPNEKHLAETEKCKKCVWANKESSKIFVQDINVRREKTMCKYGQAEYAYNLLRQILEKMFESGILTEEQFKRLDEMNKQDCFGQFCTVLEV